MPLTNYSFKNFTLLIFCAIFLPVLFPSVQEIDNEFLHILLNHQFALPFDKMKCNADRGILR